MSLRPTILVVDDVALVRDFVALALSSVARVVTAGDDESACALLDRERPRLVVAHHPPAGPGPSVCEVAKRAGGQRPPVPVILLVAGERPDDRGAAVRAGADDVLTKPLDRVTLLAAVRRLLAAPAPRGLPRVPVETPVRLAERGREHWGVARNLSRGGIFVETVAPLTPDTELQLEFPLPDDATVLAPTATVVWRRDETRGAGVGLRFLALDGAGARRLAQFVSDHLAAPTPAPLLEAL